MKFDYDFFSSEFDDDIDEEDELEIIASLMEGHEPPGDVVSIVNPKRMLQVFKAIKSIEKAVRADNPEAKINCELHMPNNDGFGSVSIEGTGVVIRRVKEVASALELADNLDAYPLENGNVHIDIGFYDLTVPIGFSESE